MAKSTLRQFYDQLPERSVSAPKADFVRKVAAECRVECATVRCWIYGTQKPDSLRTSIVAKMIGVKEDEVFKTDSNHEE